MNIHSSYKINNSLESLKSISRNSYRNLLPKTIINKSKTGWTAPINLWRMQFKKECKDINKIVSQIIDVQKLPEDKRWAPILHFLTWKKIFNMHF